MQYKNAIHILFIVLGFPVLKTDKCLSQTKQFTNSLRLLHCYRLLVMGAKKFLLPITGLLLVLAGVLVKWAVFPPIYEATIDRRLKLENGTMGYKRWSGEDLSVPAFKRFTVFNFTNPEEMKAGKKPILVEV